MSVQNYPPTFFSTTCQDPWGDEALVKRPVIVDRKGVKLFNEETGTYQGEITLVKKPFIEALNDAVGNQGVPVLGNLKQLLGGLKTGERIANPVYVKNYRKELAYFKKLQDHLNRVILPRIRRIHREKKLERNFQIRREDAKKIFSYFKKENDAKTFASHAFAKYHMLFSRTDNYLKALEKNARKIDSLVKQLQSYVTVLENLSKKTITLPIGPSTYVLLMNDEEEEKKFEVAQTINIAFKEDPIGINQEWNSFKQPPDLAQLEKSVNDFYNSQEWEEGGVDEEYIVGEIKKFDQKLSEIRESIPKAQNLKTSIERYLARNKLALNGPSKELLKVFSVHHDPNVRQKINSVVRKFFDHRKAATDQMKTMSDLLQKLEQPKVLSQIDNTLNWLYLIATFGRKLSRLEIARYTVSGVPVRPKDL